MMGYPFHKLHAIYSRRRDIMQEISHHKRPTPALEHSHYKWASPWTKPQRRHQQLILLTRTGSSWTPAQPSVPLETIILSKTSNPVMQDSNSGYTQMVDTKTMTTPKLLKFYLLKFFKWTIPCKHTLLFRSVAQVQDHHWHWIGPVHQRTPSQWHKDNI